MRRQPIGVFDSGVGGLTVVRELLKYLPSEKIVYFGDTARVPYGTKSRKAIIRFSLENTLFLLKKKVKLVILACNTSSSIALPIIRKNFKVPLIGVIEPAVRVAVRITRGGRIGVIGTRATVESKVYETKIKRLNKRINVFSKACPLFVPFVEEGCLKGSAISDVVAMYLEDFKRKKVDTLILGCTHYPLLKEQIARFLGDSVVLVDSGLSVAIEVKRILVQRGLTVLSSQRPSAAFFVSDEPARFQMLGRKFLKKNIKNVIRVNR